jgi:hypothetical protein
VALGSNQEHVRKAVAVKAALELEVMLPLFGRDEVAGRFRESCGELAGVLAVIL